MNAVLRFNIQYCLSTYKGLSKIILPYMKYTCRIYLFFSFWMKSFCNSDDGPDDFSIRQADVSYIATFTFNISLLQWVL